MRVITTLSGGKASAWCANWALNNFPKEDVILYFNDTKWEHPDLYRFLDDLSKYFNHPITIDSDGRNPEQVCYDVKFLANNRVPLCSRYLKAERLQKYYQDGDILIFGIDEQESHRAIRIDNVYQEIQRKTKKYCEIVFPLIEEKVTKEQVDNFIIKTGIEIPLLYKLGFTHNNCSGGCVRAGKKHWRMLLQKLPDVYAERERFEEEFRQRFNSDCSIFKDETLKQLREKFQHKHWWDYLDEEDEKESDFECIGICNFNA